MKYKAKMNFSLKIIYMKLLETSYTKKTFRTTGQYEEQHSTVIQFPDSAPGGQTGARLP